MIWVSMWNHACACSICVLFYMVEVWFYPFSRTLLCSMIVSVISMNSLHVYMSVSCSHFGCTEYVSEYRLTGVVFMSCRCRQESLPPLTLPFLMSKSQGSSSPQAQSQFSRTQPTVLPRPRTKTELTDWPSP